MRIGSLKGTLTEGKLSGATVQFSSDTPLSEAAVRMIVARRIAEVNARG